MKAASFLLCLVLFATSLFAQYNAKNLSIPENAEDQYTYKNLRLFPVRANAEFLDAFKDIGKYLTLTKALDEKKVLITEAVDTARRTQIRQMNNNRNINQEVQHVTAGESVNKLFIENVSPDTVLVMAGEVVKGGKQDRMIAQNFILPPHSGKQDLSVFCVEHGRWTYGGGGASLGVSGFASDHHYSSNSMRKVAIVEKDQQGVWDEVSNVTSKNNAGTSSGTYTALKESKEYKEDMEAYVSFFKNSIQGQDNVIGFVASTGDSVIGCDMFATPDMFRGQLDNILQSYATEAITNGSASKVNKAKAQEFLNEFLLDESTQEIEINKSGNILKNNGRKLVISKF